MSEKASATRSTNDTPSAALVRRLNACLGEAQEELEETCSHTNDYECECSLREIAEFAKLSLVSAEVVIAERDALKAENARLAEIVEEWEEWVLAWADDDSDTIMTRVRELAESIRHRAAIDAARKAEGGEGTP